MPRTTPSGRPGPERRSVRRGLRAWVREVVGGSGPPTMPVGIHKPGSGLPAEVERSVLDMALRTGEAMVATGAPVADTTLAMHRFLAGLGVTSAQIDITFNSITASVERDDDPLTRVRVIDQRTSDYTRLAALSTLVEETASGELAPLQVQQRLDVLLKAAHPYRRSVVTIALGAMAAGVAVLLGGGWQVALLAAATTAVIDRTMRVLRHRGLPYLFQQAFGAGIVTVVALLLLAGQSRFGWDAAILPPSLVVASGIVVLLAGLSLVGAAQDAISGFPLTSAARSFEVVLYTVGIVVGIGFVLDVGNRFGVPLTIVDVTVFSAPTPIRVAAGAVIAAAWSIASYTRPRMVLLVGLVGAVGVLTQNLLELTGLGDAGQAFGAALVIGVGAGLVARWVGTPALVLTVGGITPLLPGLAIYGAMFDIVRSGDVLSGAVGLVEAISIGLALAAGVTLGEFAALNTRAGADRWQHALRRRARGTRI